MTLKTRLACLMAALAVGVALVCGALPAPVSAKSYRITRVDIGARLNADGSMEVSEARTYAFSGSFTFAYRDFPVGRQVTFDDFEVYEDGVLQKIEALGLHALAVLLDRYGRVLTGKLPVHLSLHLLVRHVDTRQPGLMERLGGAGRRRTV